MGTPMHQNINITRRQKQQVASTRRRPEVIETDAVLYHNDQVELGAYPRRLDRAMRNRLLAN